MKSIIYGFLGLVLCIASIYIFIPDQIIISTTEQVESSDRVISEYLNSNSKRQQWWPKISSRKSITPDITNPDLNGYEYQFKPGNSSSTNVLIIKKDLKINSVIFWQSLNRSTYKITWRTVLRASKNPIERLLQYQEARQVKQNMNLIFIDFLTFIAENKNVYQFNIERRMVKDTILATSSMLSASYPETTKIYNLIDEVRAYAVKHGSKPVNVPMLNVSRDPKGEYLTIVAIPIDKNIKTSKSVKVKYMVPGNILVTEVKGGPGKVAEGFNQMKNYINDFKLMSPAIPFESLVTDRVKESDTSKWITRIYYPIF